MRLPSLMLATLVAAAPLAWAQGKVDGNTLARETAVLSLSAAVQRAEAVNPVLRTKRGSLIGFFLIRTVPDCSRGVAEPS